MRRKILLSSGSEVEMHEEEEELGCHVKVKETSVTVHSTKVAEQEVKVDKLPQRTIKRLCILKSS